MNVQPISQNQTAGTSALSQGDANSRETGAELRQAQATAASNAAVKADPMQAVSAAPRSAREEAQDPANGDKVRQAVDDVQKFVDRISQNLQFSLDDDLGRTVIKVVDRQTDEVLRQIPSEEMLDIARALGKLKGLLVEQKV